MARQQFQLYRMIGGESQSCTIRVENHPGGAGFRVSRVSRPESSSAHLSPTEERFEAFETASMRAEMDRVRAKYDAELDAKFAAARGFVDAIITPEDTRKALALALRTTLNNPGPHLGIPMLPGPIEW